MNRFEKERAEMIELLRQRGIKNEQLLEAMQRVDVNNLFYRRF